MPLASRVQLNGSAKECVRGQGHTDDAEALIEVHSPGLQADPVISAAAVGLFDDGEPTTTTGSPKNTFIDHDPRPAESLIPDEGR